jgi:hypothetical protein
MRSTPPAVRGDAQIVRRPGDSQSAPSLRFSQLRQPHQLKSVPAWTGLAFARICV